jgi:hypothetical protein
MLTVIGAPGYLAFSDGSQVAFTSLSRRRGLLPLMETTDTTPNPEPASTGFVHRNRRWLAAGGAALALLTAGFGMGVAGAQDNGDTTTTTEAQAEEGDRPTEEEIQAFRDCMADNGVELPEERPEPGSERPERTEEERAAFREALEACEDLKPEGFGRGPGCGPGGPGGPGERPDESEDAPAEDDTQGS